MKYDIFMYLWGMLASIWKCKKTEKPDPIIRSQKRSISEI